MAVKYCTGESHSRCINCGFCKLKERRDRELKELTGGLPLSALPVLERIKIKCRIAKREIDLIPESKGKVKIKCYRCGKIFYTYTYKLCPECRKITRECNKYGTN